MPVSPSENEDKYFALQDSQTRERMREQFEKKAAELADADRVAETLHTDDANVVAKIRALGFDGDTARAFELLPLIHVAWADDSVSIRERRQILRVAESRGIEVGSEAFLLIEALLEKKPSDAFLDETLALLREIVAEEPERANDIVELSVAVAEASGGFLGLGEKVSTEERELLQHIAGEIGAGAQDALRSKLSKK